MQARQSSVRCVSPATVDTSALVSRHLLQPLPPDLADRMLVAALYSPPIAIEADFEARRDPDRFETFQSCRCRSRAVVRPSSVAAPLQRHPFPLDRLQGIGNGQGKLGSRLPPYQRESVLGRGSISALRQMVRNARRRGPTTASVAPARRYRPFRLSGYGIRARRSAPKIPGAPRSRGARATRRRGIGVARYSR